MVNSWLSGIQASGIIMHVPKIKKKREGNTVFIKLRNTVVMHIYSLTTH
jgi:hypothetical protein